MSPSTLSSTLLYTASFLSLSTIFGHLKFGHDLVYPSLAKVEKSEKDKGVITAKIGWVEGCLNFGVMGLFCIKWANHGLTDVYDKAYLGMYTLCQLYFGSMYVRGGIYEPLVPLIGIPAFVAVGVLV